MTETEKKALELLNEVCVERGLIGGWNKHTRETHVSIETLCRAIEQHEAFRQEVSDAVEGFYRGNPYEISCYCDDLKRFIIAKPDPLVEALGELADRNMEAEQAAETLRAAIEARGGRIVWEGE